MPKRTGSNRQLRPHEIEALESRASEGPGVFEMADADTIKQRRIVRSKKKKRRSGTSSFSISATSNGGGLSFMASESSAPKKEEDAKPKNLFAGFTGLTDGLGDEAPSFSFPKVDLSKPMPQTPKSEFSIGNFGDGAAIFGGSAADSEKKGEGQDITLTSNPVFLPLAAPTTETSAPQSTNGKNMTPIESYSESNSASFVRRRRRLNKSFHKWVCRQMESNEYSDWTIGVQDYINHMKKLKAQKKTISSSSVKSTLPAPPKDERGGDSVVDVVKTSDSGSGEVKVHQVRAKYFEFDQEAKEYKTKGLGELRVMKDNASGKSRVLMYDACLRLKLNLGLYAGITYELTGKKKNNVSFIANAAEGPVSFMIRVKTGAAAAELKSVLEANSK